MPRTGRGGSRQGTPGESYSNRSDLNVKTRLPMQAATGQAYGEATTQMNAQRAVPMGRPATDAVPVGNPSTPPAPAVPPGAVTPLHAPSERPDEPVTAGLPVGAGAGPAGLNLLTATAGYSTATQQVQALADAAPDNPALQYLASRLQVRF